MTPERIMEIAERPETPSFLFGSAALEKWTRQHRNSHTGECFKSSVHYVVIHPSLNPEVRDSHRVLSCWNVGEVVPRSWDIDESVGFADKAEQRGPQGEPAPRMKP